jgi:hypothetical protein
VDVNLRNYFIVSTYLIHHRLSDYHLSLGPSNVRISHILRLTDGMTVISSIPQYIAPIVASPTVVVAAGSLSLVPVIDLAVCAYYDLQGVLNSRVGPLSERPDQKEIRLVRKEKMKSEMVVHGVGALVLGACASNRFPGSGIVGLAGYVTYAHYAWKSEYKKTHPSPVIIATGVGLEVLSHYKKEIAKSVGSALLKAGTWTIATLYGIVLKVIHVGQAVVHGLRVGAKAIGGFLHAIVVVPIKALAKVPRIFMACVRHPVLGLGVLAGIVCLIGCIKYTNTLTRASQASAYLVKKSVRGIFSAIPLFFRGAVKAAKLLGKVLYFLPAILIKIVQVICSIVHAIFHPLQTLGFSKVKTSI